MKNLETNTPFSINQEGGVLPCSYGIRLNYYSSMYVADWIPFSATITLYIFTVSGREGAI